MSKKLNRARIGTSTKENRQSKILRDCNKRIAKKNSLLILLAKMWNILNRNFKRPIKSLLMFLKSIHSKFKRSSKIIQDKSKNG